MTPPAPPVIGSERKGWLDRTLSLVTDVRPGEGAGALLLAINVFALFAMYYVLKTVREGLILSEGGAEVKSYAAAGQALLLLGFVPAYGAVASRVNRLTLINGVTIFFASHLVLFFFLGRAGVDISLAFFLWLGIFAVVMPAQFWAFANDVYDADRGKRLFPIVGIGTALGAWLGASLASQLVALIDPYRLLVVAAVGIVINLAVTRIIDRRMRRSRESATSQPEAPLSKTGGFQLVFSQRYLLYIALLVLVLNIVNSVGEYVLSSLVVANAQEAVASGAAGAQTESVLITAWYGRFFAWVNFLGFILQLFVVSRLFKYIGVRGTLFVLPVVSAFTYGTGSVAPVLAVFSLVKILENSTDYSINNTAKHALFLPTSREAKYKAKQAIDSFFFRAGDMLQAVVVFTGVQMALDARGFAVVNLGFIAVWFLLCIAIAREHRTLTMEPRPSPVRGEAAAHAA